jgi:TolA-binding protein
LARAQIGAAPEPGPNLQAYNQALNTALTTYRQAQERVQRVLEQDPDARVRRGLIMLEIADTLQLLKQYKEAANVYNQMVNEKMLPEREEETFLRLIQAQHLANEFNEADKLVAAFQARFPKSTLAPHVLFNFAENSYFRGLAAEKNPNAQERAKEVARIHEDTIKRFQAVIEKYPEFPRLGLARYSLGLAHYRRGELDKALEAWKAIPPPDRNGDLGLVNYLMADCQVRLAPTTAPEDALAAGKLEEQLKDAANLLGEFIGGQPNHPQMGDAVIKLGLAQQRLAGIMAQPAEKLKILAIARTTYERFGAKELSGHPLAPQALLERAKVLAQMPNEMGNAINDLRRFTNDPLKNSGVAPMALIQLGTYLRTQNNANEAVKIMTLAREQHEANLAKDPEKSPMLIQLRYHHGLALREAGKLSEARGVFDQVVKQGGNRPEIAEAALRMAQCLKDEGQQKLDVSRKVRLGAKKPEDFAQAQKLEGEGYQHLRDTVNYLEGQANNIGKAEGMQDLRARMLYEAAWATRFLAEPEVASARKGKEEELIKKLGPKAAQMPPPNIPMDQVPLQPAEKKARDLYRTLVTSMPDVALAVEARFELAELLAQRLEYEAAATLLNEALDKEPAQDMTEKIRLRLGALQSARGNVKGALSHYETILANPKSAMLGWAHYQAGEALLLDQQFAEAAKRLIIFRDNPQYGNISGLTDKALLRLGHAFAFLKDWNNSRTAHERVVGAFPNSPLVDDARYGMAWAWQMQGQHDQAVNTYTQITGRTATELAAKAQLQIGLCRLEQKRHGDAVAALLVVPFTYDFPELSAAALLEAARALAENRQNAQAIRLLERVQREYTGTPFADAAAERLKTLRRP